MGCRGRNIALFLLTFITTWAAVACICPMPVAAATHAEHACCLPEKPVQAPIRPLHDGSCFRCIDFGLATAQSAPQLAPTDAQPFVAALPPASEPYAADFVRTRVAADYRPPQSNHTLLDLRCALNL